MSEHQRPLKVSIAGLPGAMLAPVAGLYEILNLFGMLSGYYDVVPAKSPFAPEIVGLPDTALTAEGGGIAVNAHRTIEAVEQTDIVFIPSMMVAGGEWQAGRYPEFVDWLARMHAAGTMVCAACSGALLLAETGLLDGRDATVHWAFANTFRRHFPQVNLRVDEVLVAAGARQELITTGASGSWHDLMLYLVARHVGPTSAQALAKFMLLDWHRDAQTPYSCFVPCLDHGDALVCELQRWLHRHFTDPHPVEAMLRQSDLPERSLQRRFSQATGYAPLAYTQHLRIEAAKTRLERTDEPIDEIAWTVGYEDPAFFRRLFKRTAGVTPGAYRRKFSLPAFALAPGEPADVARKSPNDT